MITDTGIIKKADGAEMMKNNVVKATDNKTWDATFSAIDKKTYTETHLIFWNKSLDWNDVWIRTFHITRENIVKVLKDVK